MEVTDVARLATTMASTATAEAVNVAVLKKAMNIQADSATALLQALPPVTPANLPPHLGQNINTTA